MGRAGKQQGRRHFRAFQSKPLNGVRRRTACERLEPRLLLSGDGRFTGNASLATAANVGVGPGVHIAGLTLAAGDNDWYRFQVLRTDSVDVKLGFAAANGQLNLEVRNASGTIDVTGANNANGATATLAGLAPGTYYAHVSGATPTTTNTFSISVDPSGTSTTRVLYVNDGSTTNDFYSLAAGSNSNSGLSPSAPMATVQNVLATFTLGPTDLVVIDTGTYGGNAIQITSENQGAAYAGSPGASTFHTGVQLSGAGYDLLYGLTFANFGGDAIHSYPNGAALSTHNTFSSNTFSSVTTAIEIDAGDTDLVIGNTISSSGSNSNGVLLSGTTNATVQGNTVSGAADAIFDSASPNLVADFNSLSNGSRGVFVGGGVSGVQIHDNSFSQFSTYAVYLGSTASAFANQISTSTVGIESVPGTNAAIYGNQISGNTIGVEGYSSVGGSGWAAGQPNDIHDNQTGVSPYGSATVAYNRIRNNTVGIDLHDTAAVNHNLIYRNTGKGILVEGAHDLAIQNNTIYTSAGDGVRIQSSAANITLKNNIIWTDSGYDLYVATDSQQGFASDYNNLFTTGGSGKLVGWQKDFTDLFDWQIEANYDTHSIGYTAVSPTRDNPQFVNLTGDDYHLTSQVSTSIAAGDPASLYNQQPSPSGGRIELGAYGNTSDAALAAASLIQLDYPNYYTDWEVNVGHAIQWHAYNVTGNVTLALYQQGVGFVTNIATVDVGNNPGGPPNAPVNGVVSGAYGWSPTASGISGSTTNRYFIKVTSVANSSVAAQSRENFSVPAAGDDYYVNDSSTANDEWSTAVGNNRNTGKTPGDPKANLLPMLRSFQLGPGTTVHIDTGNYIEVRNVVISGNLTIGNGQGTTFTGPDNGNPASVAVLDRANTNAGTTNIDVNAGSFVTLAHLTLLHAQHGLWVRNASTNFHGSYLTVSNNTSDGIRAEADATASQFDHLIASGNSGDGIFIGTPISSLSNSQAYNNSRVGIDLSNPGAATLTNDVVYGNQTGINVSNGAGGAPTTIGDSNLANGDGNFVDNDSQYGITATGNVLVAGNTVYGNALEGIDLSGGATASLNVVHDNRDGIVAVNPGIVNNNRVYHNTNRGIVLYYSSQATGNVVYSNAIGIDGAGAPFFGSISNNLIYANSSQGILLESSVNAQLTNNTVYQPTGDGIGIQTLSRGIRLRNNIVWAQTGYDLNVAPDSQQTFNSDFNDLYTTGTGQTAFWQGLARPTFFAWQNTAFDDQNSLAHDPMFVNPIGADGVLGYNGSGINDGRDDDFHLLTRYGYYTGSQAPVASTVTGKPVMPAQNLVTDGSAPVSPAIDRGDPTSTFANEPSPNGNFINLGHDGNTSQASLSPSQYVLVTRPDGGEVWPAAQTFAVRWRSQDFNGTVNVDLMEQGNPAPVLHIATNIANSGQYNWAIPNSLAPAADYLIRVSRGAVVGTSDSPFTITAPVHFYYVNDGQVVAGDQAINPGNDSNDGLSWASPKQSISAVLNAYNVGTGDIIYVDNGLYNLSSNILLTAAQSGVTIEGPATGAAVLNRGNTSPGSEAFQFQGGSNITLDRLSITGGSEGVLASGTSNITISNNQIFGNSSYGIDFTGTNDAPHVTNNTAHDNTSENIVLYQGLTNAVVTGNVAYNASYDIDVEGTGNTISGNEAYSAGNSGIYVSNGTNTVSGNTVHDSYAGISATHKALVTGNSVYRQSHVGISIAYGAQATLNVVHDNGDGIDVTSSATAYDNRIFHNVNRGIEIDTGSVASGNTVYSNPIGIDVQGSSLSTIAHNLVYANSSAGILIEAANYGASLTNNTVYQPAGDALKVQTHSINVSARDNIFYVQAGYDMNVDPDSQSGFSSDYNDLYATGAGKLTRWQGTDFSTLADWIFEVGQDAHTLSVDPQFVDPAGTDGVLGFSTTTVAPAQFEDNASSGFSESGSWSSQPGGVLGHNYSQSTGTAPSDVATWTFTGLTPNSWVNVAASWPANNFAYNSQFSVLDGDQAISSVIVDQTVPPADFTDGATWKNLGLFYVTGSTLTVKLTHIGSQVVADAVRIQQIAGDHGLDDNFHVASSSPTIDVGDPTAVYLAETPPSGARVNMGADGNTPSATVSASQTIRVDSPIAFQKVQVGQTVPIKWSSDGLRTTRYVGLINVGGSAADNWSADAFTTAGGGSGSNNVSIDISGVANPAPQAVYQSYGNAPGGIGQELAYNLPVPDGTYTIRLHFAETSFVGVGGRVFDIKLQGSVPQGGANYDILSAAGAYDKATTATFSVTASGGTGIQLELVNDTDNPAILSGIELTAANPSGVASPTADVQVSTDNGGTWATLATGLSMDAYGRGTYNWTVGPTTTLGNTALIRVQAEQGNPAATGLSRPFLIANAGHDYYVNDNSTAGDFFTTSIGNNAASGKSPDQPMADLAALLNTYHLGPGDTVHVDTGNYNLFQNAVLGPQHSGVLIQGPPAGGAVLNRGSTLSTSEVFQLAGASNVTLDHLAITGGYYGITGTGSSGLTVSNDQIYGNSYDGIYLDSSNNQVQVVGNSVHGNSVEGIQISGVGDSVSGNTVSGGSYGIDVSGGTNTVSANDVSNASTGILGTSSTVLTISGNTVHDNTGYGISTSQGVNSTGNFVYRNQYGMYVQSSQASQNIVHDNGEGIVVYFATVSGNRVYHNVNQGIELQSAATAQGNVVYDNAIGVTTAGQYANAVTGNQIYANASQGILVGPGPAETIGGNTVDQPIGDAIKLQNGVTNVSLRNNILTTGDGYDIDVNADCETGFSSDFNDLFVSGAGKLVRWQGTDFTTRAAWFYGTGQDGHGQSADPQFVNPTGPDGILGFSTVAAAAAQFEDNMSAGFSEAGSWTSQPGGVLGHNDSQSTGTAPSDVATWTFSVAPNSWFNVAASWPANSFAYDSQFAVLDGSQVLFSQNLDERSAPTDFTDGGVGWKNFGLFSVAGGTLTVRLTHFDSQVLADAVRIQQIQGDHGLDDNFHVASASSTIDAGDPASPFANEPAPNGGRVNLGSDGNTSFATQSPAQTVQILAPTEFAKVTVGQVVPVQFATTGVSGTVSIQLSTDSGAHYTTLASGVALNPDGTGSYNWTVGPTTTTANTALIRVQGTGGSPPTGVSRPFEIVPAGHDYYINDTSTAGDVFTSAVGNNVNTGKSPGAPMADLAALVNAYSLGAGDIVHVDTGNYSEYQNVILGAQHSGVLIQGPAAGGGAVLNRGNTLSSSDVIQLSGVTDATVDHLVLTGGYSGISGTGSTNFTASNDQIYGNANNGVDLEGTDNNVHLTGDALHDDVGYGAYLSGTNALVSGGSAYNNQYGIYVLGNGSTIATNDVYSNSGTGIVAQNAVTVSGNTVHDNTSVGIYALYGAVATGNAVYHNGGDGIDLYGATATNNVVHENLNGIYAIVPSVISNNRVYHNSNMGIRAVYGSPITGNTVYSNAIGIEGDGANSDMVNNLVYANSADGIRLVSASNMKLVNNTIYQPVGDAVKIDSSSQNIALRNNILWILAGYDVDVDPNSTTGFNSDNNLFDTSTDPNAHVGLWNGSASDTLADWQSASGEGQRSHYGNPQFVNIAGADHVLGYSTAGNGYDGGPDDNFHLAAGSPAIDSANPWYAPPTDKDGNSRVDDPGSPNLGFDYAESNLGSNEFNTGGVAQNWRGYQTNWSLSLPFAFPLYGTTYSSLYVTSSGFLQFATTDSLNDSANSTAKLIADTRIAPFWANIRTDRPGDDIFVDTSTSGQVTIRWAATSAVDNISPVNFAVTLFSDGRIRFDYGAGNADLSPTIGISRGDGHLYQLSAYNGQSALGSANSTQFALAQVAYVDVGAYEFQGSSLNTTPPRVLATNPAAIGAGGSISGTFSQIGLTFNEALDSIDANAPATYQLVQDTNGDSIFGDSGDTTFAVSPTYNTGATSVTLNINGGNLPFGSYQFTIPGAALHSVSGVALDGAGNGTSGSDYVRTFSLGDPLTVINANDSGPGSLRAAVLYANGLSGTTHTITFALPSGPQSIHLLTPLPATTAAVVALVDATQNVTVVSHSNSDFDSFNSLSKIGDGTLTLAGANSLSGPLAVHAGVLQFNDSTTPQLAAGVTVAVDGPGSLQLAGIISALSGGATGVHVANDSSAAAGLDVVGNNQVVGGIDGVGNVVIETGADLTANSINQNALVIGAGGAMTIAASDTAGNPLAGGVANPSGTASGIGASRLAALLAKRQAAAHPLVSDSTDGAAFAGMTLSVAAGGAAPTASSTAAGPQAIANESGGDANSSPAAGDPPPSLAQAKPLISPVIAPPMIPEPMTGTSSAVRPQSLVANGSSIALASPSSSLVVAADSPVFGRAFGGPGGNEFHANAIDFALADSADPSPAIDDHLLDLLSQDLLSRAAG